MFKHILIPTDGSAVSTRAAAAGVSLAKAVGARVTGLFAAPPPTPVVYRDMLPVGYQPPEEHAAAIQRTAEKALGAIERAASAAGVAYEGLTVTSDFPADAILETAQDRKCDLVFMASHGRHGLAALILGSETHKVLTQAKIPVLVYR